MAFYCNGKKDICECDILCADCQHYDNTGGKKWQTRADRIRTMSDEELARCLLTVDDAGKYCKNLPECEKLLDTPEGIPEEKCLGCLVDWLREPEGEQHEQKP